ncbi:MAG: LacI family DNA-binding transcriptional regulator [Kiritimatiellia bacterium]|nr:LacI family transcriptional regulator [Lentisphaerota bacterium]
MVATLKHVADRAGVSIRTVTRVLKDEPGTNPETYMRVRSVVDELGYIPNVAARNLKTSSITMVGVVAPGNPKSEFITRKRAALQKRLENEGRYLLSGTLRETEDQLRDMLKEWIGLTRDVVFLAWPNEFSTARVLAGLPMHFVFVNCLDERAYDHVLIDRAVGVYEGVQCLLRTGHRRIAHCGTNMRERRHGFEGAFDRPAGGQVVKLLIKTPHMDFEDGFAAGPRIMEQQADAVFFDTDRMAYGFYHFAREQGVRIPDDISVIGFDDEPGADYACPPLSSVSHPIAAISEQVCEMIKQPAAATREVMLPTYFVRRESVRDGANSTKAKI